jgi:hypothetical protein
MLESMLRIQGHEQLERRLVEQLAREKNYQKASQLEFNLRLTRARLEAERLNQSIKES